MHMAVTVCGVDGYIRSIYLGDCNLGGISFLCIVLLVVTCQVGVTDDSGLCYMIVLLQSALLHDCLTSVSPVT